ncbi:phage tail repeat-like family [Trichomonas vaginalis G3]|uniref:phage tail repeat-like family n=1 Tax=Trichomonas vaginalis (strain ATCC PRA-98 / G3) TaxID=412133 RepID=UPI0021E5ECBE|nr:phage tail repeat-like family [Trichomonas vaginalis G3]KAI5503649.1 phage tail repeat-like family [Trichomonas vaginalis G3]
MNFTKPPLPFFGNKSRCKDILLRELKKLPNGLTFVDLFGGSFYISHLCHTVFPDSKIICNDFDNYMNRLKHIPDTNKILKELKEKIPIGKMERIPLDKKDIVREVLKKAEYIDWDSISARLLYSGAIRVHDIETLMSKVLYLNYTNVFKEDIEKYIEGIEFVRCHWTDLYEKYKDKENVFFIVDPPFYNTWDFQYQVDWTLRDSLETLDVLHNHPCFYFTSDKSGLETVMRWLEDIHDYEFIYDKIEYERGPINWRKCHNKEILLVSKCGLK